MTEISSFRMKGAILCCLLLPALSAAARCATCTGASDTLHAATHLHGTRLAILGATGIGVHYVGFRYFARAWYQGRKQNHIRWINDWGGDTYLDLDKAGHFMGAMVMAQSIQDGLVWGGVPLRTSAVLGSLISWGVMLEIEMRDAYYADWGFSVPDFTANTLGATWAMMQVWVPQTQVVQFKGSYHPSSLYLHHKKRAAENRPHIDSLIDDYEGMTFWATLRLNDVLPSGAASRWPDFLGVAVGYGATGLHGANVKSRGPNKYYPDLPDAQPEVFIALDYDTRCLPGQGATWSYLKTWLNWIHWPAPTVRVYPSFRFYLLYM